MIKILLLFTLSFGSLVMNSQEILRYNLEVDDTFTVLQEATQKITQDLPQGQQIINNKINGTLFFKVIEATSQEYVVEISFKEFKMSMSSPSLGEMMYVDTRAPGDDVESKMFLGMLNRPMQMVLLPTGEIKEIRNGDAIINGMLESFEDLDESTIAIMRKQLEEQWDSEVLSDSFEQMTFLYPQEAQTIESTWENSYAGKGKIHADNTWTYLQKKESSRFLTAKADITMDLSTEAISMKLKGQQTTTATTTVETGFIEKLTVQGKASGDGTLPQAPDMKIPTTIISTTTYTLQ